MLRRAILLLLALFLASAGASAETVLAEPKPTPDKPRRIVLSLTSGDPAEINGVLYNVANIQKFYGQDNVEVAVVAYGKGIVALLKGQSPVAERIQSLKQYDVAFIACGNTLTAMNKKAEDLLPGVEHVTAGIPEIVERQIKGWMFVKP